jgi:hypothetical protein
VISRFKYLVQKLHNLGEPEPHEFRCDYVRSEVLLEDGSLTKGFVACRTIDGRRQYRLATQTEIDDYVAFHMTP